MRAGGILYLIVILVNLLAAQGLPTVAIIQFEASGMEATDATNITSRFSYELSRANRFRITEREMMERILKEQKFQLSECTSSDCVVEVGQLLNVRYMIAGTISKTFDLYSLHVRLISVESGEVVAQTVEDFEGSARDFISGTIRNAALKLAAESSTGQEVSGISHVTPTSTRTGQVVYTLNTSPVNVFIDGNFSGENNSQKINLSLPMGDHTIKFTAAGYSDYEKTVTVLPDQSIEYTVKMEPGSVAFGPAVTTGIIIVRSVPEGATVYLDGRDVGVTPIQVPKAGAGQHTIRVKATLYYDHLEQVDVQADAIIQVMAKLAPSFGSLNIISDPDGAVVSLNGQMKGRTPLKINELASGEYEITISKDLYHTYFEKFIITDGSDNKRNIRLQPAFGRMSLKSEPAGASVSLDSRKRGVTPLDINELSSGSYTLRIEMDLYTPYESEITIEDGKTFTQTCSLNPCFGTLNIDGSPIGADIIINGAAVGTIPLKLFKVPAGLAEIKVRAASYHPKTQFQQVNVGDLLNLDIQLERHTGNVLVLTDPPGAHIALNDRNQGVSPKILLGMPTGKYKLAITHTEYLPVNEDFNLALDERKEFNIKLLTYVGSIRQEIDRVKRKRNLNIVASGVLGITAGALQFISMKTYTDYENASTSTEAVDLYDKANTLNKLSGYVGTAAGLSAIPILKRQVEIRKLISKVNKGHER